MTNNTVRTEVEWLEAHYWTLCDIPRIHEGVTCDWSECEETATCVAFLVDDVQQGEAANSGHFLYCQGHGARVLRMAQEVEVRLPNDQIRQLWEERARALYEEP